MEKEKKHWPARNCLTGIVVGIIPVSTTRIQTSFSIKCKWTERKVLFLLQFNSLLCYRYGWIIRTCLSMCYAWCCTWLSWAWTTRFKTTRRMRLDMCACVTATLHLTLQMYIVHQSLTGPCVSRSLALRSIAMTAGSLAPTFSPICTMSSTLCGFEFLRQLLKWRERLRPAPVLKRLLMAR